MTKNFSDEKYFSNFLSPIGNIIIETTNEFILSVKFSKEIALEKKNNLTDEVSFQLEEYFSGKRKTFKLQLKLNGTDFQNKVWQRLQEIPYGTFMSYENFSEIIGDKKKIRAVANANSKNPFAIIIPCHRVIGKNGKLVGYAGGLDKKQWLIDFELSHTNNLFKLF